IVDRRRLILITQIGLFAATLLLGVAALAGVVGPALLLFLTFVVGAGFTFYLPAQQSSINELVPRAELPRAVALGAVAFNVARDRSGARGCCDGMAGLGQRFGRKRVLLRDHDRRDAQAPRTRHRGSGCARAAAVGRDERRALRAPFAGDALVHRPQFELRGLR